MLSALPFLVLVRDLLPTDSASCPVQERGKEGPVSAEKDRGTGGEGWGVQQTGLEAGWSQQPSSDNLKHLFRLSPFSPIRDGSFCEGRPRCLFQNLSCD